MTKEEYILRKLESLSPADKFLSERMVKDFGKDWVTPKEVANYLGRHPNTIYEKISEDEVLYKRIGRRIVIYTPSIIFIME